MTVMICQFCDKCLGEVDPIIGTWFVLGTCRACAERYWISRPVYTAATARDTDWFCNANSAFAEIAGVGS